MFDLFAELKRDSEKLNKNTTMLTVTVFSVFFVGFAIMNLVLNKTELVIVQGGVSLGLILCVIFYRVTKLFSAAVIGILVTLSALMGYYIVTGGSEGFHVIWTLIIPPAAAYFLKLFYGGIFSVSVGVMLVIYFWTPLHLLGYPYTQNFAIRFPLVYLLVLVVSLYTNYMLWKNNKKQQELTELAENANRAKSNFLAQMSHEIRTPINAVLGMNEMILRESQEENVIEYASNAYNAGNTLLSIINDILDISKIEAGKLEIVESDYELYSLVSDCYLMVADRAEKKGLALSVECDEKIPSKLKGDMFHIRQIAVNFLTNAIKYTDEGSVSLKFSGEKSEGIFSLRISVKDTGIGLTEESIEKLFSSFQRFELQRNRFVEGTGLGLSISKQLAKLMGGTIEVVSTYGEGSEFICTVPQYVTDQTPIGKIQPERMAAKLRTDNEVFTAPDANVLVVDDVEMNLVVFASLLKHSKMCIDTADSGMKCLEMIKEKKYDVIFMDHMMPEMSGIETFRRMRESEHLNNDTPVVMLTANAISGEKEKYMAEGFAFYLTKPLQSDKFERTLQRLLPPEKVIIEKAEVSKESAKAEKHVGEQGQTEPPPADRFAELKASFPDFSLKDALSNCNGSEDFYIELLKDFAVPKKSDELSKAFSNKDWESYERLIHTIKGTMRTFGFTDIGNIAEKLQFAAERRDEEFILKNHYKAAEMFSKIIGCASRLR